MHFLFVALLAIANDPRSVLVGTWEGESICTKVRPACHDEHAVYHITIPADKPGIVTMLMNKLVEGKEVEMGTTEYKVNADATELTSEFENQNLHLLWSFTRAGNEMRGTLSNASDRAVIRNIHLKKQSH
jgi:hypothetical protein